MRSTPSDTSWRIQSGRWRHALGAALFVASTVLPVGARADQATVLEIDGAIGPATVDYVARRFAEISSVDTRVVILRLNTPGGLDVSMRAIIGTILASPIPVVAYVAPSGARAASAGTFIVYASSIAAMATGTNLGAATPIPLGGSPGLPGVNPQPSGQGGAAEPASAEERKVVNDAAAYIRSLAELSGRNPDWGEQAVRIGASIPASRAVELHVVDLIADDVPDLLRKIDGRTVTVAGRSLRLATAGLDVVVLSPDWRSQLLAVVADPNVAFVLMMIGIYGLIFEFLNPGAIAPGVLGGICLLVALFALNLLPINYAGAAFVLLGVGLLIAEAHIGSFGVIGLGGIVAFAIGAIMMFPPAAPGFILSPVIVAASTFATAGFFLVILSVLLRSRRRPVVTGGEALVGAQGEVVAWREKGGQVRVKGEIWRARAAAAIEAGTRVRVLARDGLVLTVEAI